MPWPQHFPENCPPSESQPADGVFYRYVNKNTITARDFVSHLERNLAQSYDDICIAAGLSVYKDINDAKRLAQRVPAFRKKKLAKGNLTPEMGNSLPTPSQTAKSHHTWWLSIGSEPWTVFQVLEVPED